MIKNSKLFPVEKRCNIGFLYLKKREGATWKFYLHYCSVHILFLRTLNMVYKN